MGTAGKLSVWLSAGASGDHELAGGACDQGPESSVAAWENW
jgi:hypothetical protein